MEHEDWEGLDAQSPYYQLNRKKSCIGKRVLVYEVPYPIQSSFFELFESGELSFPLGENYPFYQLNIPGRFVLTGLLQGKDFKMVPRIKADLIQECLAMAQRLEQYGRAQTQ